MRYALVNPQDAVDRFDEAVDPNVQTKAGWRWLQCPVVAKPSYDPTLEKITGPTYTVGETEVTEAWAKVNLTSQELSDRNTAARTSAVDLLSAFQYGELMVLRAVMLVILDELNLHATKINAILTAIDNGSTLAQVKTNIAAIADYPARTAGQLRTAVEGKLTAGDADS